MSGCPQGYLAVLPALWQGGSSFIPVLVTALELVMRSYPSMEQFKNITRLNISAVLPWMDCYIFSSGFYSVKFVFPECHAQQLKTNPIVCNTCLTIP